MSTFGIRRAFPAGYDEALRRLPEVLKAEGFGVLTEIDLQSTLKAKLGVDFRRYKILGACNPPFAHQALETELAIGLMLPCNVVVYEEDDGGAAILAVDPTQTLSGSGDARLAALADAVKARLTAALDRLSA